MRNQLEMLKRMDQYIRGYQLKAPTDLSWTHDQSLSPFDWFPKCAEQELASRLVLVPVRFVERDTLAEIPEAVEKGCPGASGQLSGG